MLCTKIQDALDTDDLLEYAAAAGADPNTMAADLSSGAMTDRVRKDFRSGIRSGVNGRPTFFVNGQRLNGDWSDPVAFAAALHQAARPASMR